MVTNTSFTTARYDAACWAENRTEDEIRSEVERCEARYLLPYAWDSVENATYTLERIDELTQILSAALSDDDEPGDDALDWCPGCDAAQVPTGTLCRTCEDALF